MCKKSSTLPHSVDNIRNVAAIVLEALHKDVQEPELSSYRTCTVQKGYQLLFFERLITRQRISQGSRFVELGYSLTFFGRRHVEKHGYTVYNGVDKAKKPR